jgi:hypothetical protein
VAHEHPHRVFPLVIGLASKVLSQRLVRSATSRE